MKLIKKSEWFELESPLCEPNIIWSSATKYEIERIVEEDGTVVWFGINVNWKNEKGVWFELATNENAKPLEKYLLEIVYGSDRSYWAKCDIPIYEKMYNEMNNKPLIHNMYNIHENCGGYVKHTSINNTMCTKCGQTWCNI